MSATLCRSVLSHYYLFIYLLFIYSFIYHLCIYLSLFIYLFIHLFIYYLFIYLFIFLFIYLNCDHFHGEARHMMIAVHKVVTATSNDRHGVSNCLTFCSEWKQRNIKVSSYCPFVRGIHRRPLNFPHKGIVTRKTFHLMTSQCISYVVNLPNRKKPTARWPQSLPSTVSVIAVTSRKSRTTMVFLLFIFDGLVPIWRHDICFHRDARVWSAHIETNLYNGYENIIVSDL